MLRSYKSQNIFAQSKYLIFLLFIITSSCTRYTEIVVQGEGGSCIDDNECSSLYCNPEGICSNPTCSDNWQNGYETGVDCGGSCPLCENTGRGIFGNVTLGKDAQIDFAGASLFIHRGSFNIESDVGLGEVALELFTLPYSESILVSRVYEIVSKKEPSPNLVAEFTVSFEPDEIENLSDYQLAYYLDGMWITLPTSINTEEGTLSTTLHHFSFIGIIKRFLGNDPPEARINLSQTFYGGLRDADRLDLNLEDLIVEIYASDPEGKPVQVDLSVALITDGIIFGNEASALIKRSAELIKIEAAAIDIYGGQNIVFDIADKFTENAANINRRDDMVVNFDWVITDYEAVPSNALGQYYFRYRIKLNGLSLTSELNAIHLLVQIRDDLDDNPVEYGPIVIPVTGIELPGTPELVSPGPTSLITCPSTPTFNWIWDNNSDSAKTYAFFLTQGENLWAENPSWTCSFSTLSGTDCESSGTQNVWDSSWTPSASLNKGRYSWGIAMSTKDGEKEFSQRDPLIARSDIYSFTVDGSLSGTSCTNPLGTEQEIAETQPEIPEEQQDEAGSTSKIVIPSVKGKEGPEARDLIESLGLRVVNEIPSEDCQREESGPYTAEDGEYDALYTEPPGGTSVESGTTVALYVCWFAKLVEIPSVQGLERFVARDLIEAAGLGYFPEVPTEECRDDGSDGHYEALKTEPPEGSAVEPGTTVALFYCWIYAEGNADDDNLVAESDCGDKSSLEFFRVPAATGTPSNLMTDNINTNDGKWFTGAGRDVLHGVGSEVIGSADKPLKVSISCLDSGATYTISIELATGWYVPNFFIRLGDKGPYQSLPGRYSIYSQFEIGTVSGVDETSVEFYLGPEHNLYFIGMRDIIAAKTTGQ